ncbi:unnamed protein product [Rhizophagus irregularis]|nr:unnamed protein product [Rhizophagus irregularis]
MANKKTWIPRRSNTISVYIDDATIHCGQPITTSTRALRPPPLASPTSLENTILCKYNKLAKLTVITFDIFKKRTCNNSSLESFKRLSITFVRPPRDHILAALSQFQNGPSVHKAEYIVEKDPSFPVYFIRQFLKFSTKYATSQLTHQRIEVLRL